VIRDAAGKIVNQYPKAARKVAGQWVWDWKGNAPGLDLLKRVKITRIAKCVGVTAAMLLLSELVYAGLEESLGPSAASMGVRQQDCQQRFAKAAMGIQCLKRQAAATTCAQAVQACPDAFFGANMVQSCATEPGMNDFVDALVLAIDGTSARAGGFGTITPDPGNSIADAIRQGKFATDTAITCTLRASQSGCAFTPGSVFPQPAGFMEAKACWDNATRGVFESKWTEAYNCCTTDACRGFINPFKNC
jgi:hypothetical protein